VTLKLLELGYRVVCADFDEKALSLLKQELSDKYKSRFSIVVCDVSKEESIIQTIKHAISVFGILNGAVNNAGIAGKIGFGRLADHTLEEWNKTMDTNGRGVFLCMKYEILQFLNQMKQNPNEKSVFQIVNMASVAGIGKSEGQSVYGASKHAVVGLTRSAAAEYARLNIRVNSVCPGMTATRMVNLTGTEEEKKLVQFILDKGFPTRRLSTPEEVASAVVFLVSKEAYHINGIQLAVDGGFSAH